MPRHLSFQKLVIHKGITDFQHLQDAVHRLGLHQHRAVLHPVVQAQVINST